ncbi:uncharacterized protein LOC131046614 [Cryptomeria japonica]|uniref:uncharacterized protein LOC131046614 n=1 Tax=Cryptomeria japonica TaxID=3369 RepID=UPI0025ABB181|nr:uncharacterized protein LOC131046614 [Cryptomeria japonica]
MEVRNPGKSSHLISATTNRFPLQPKLTQLRSCSVTRPLVSDRLRCSINSSCTIQLWPKLTGISPTDNMQRFKSRTRHRSCSAIRNGDHSFPEEDNPEDKRELDSSELSDAGGRCEPSNLDWRSFRARLVASEQIHKTENSESGNITEFPNLLGSKWAHPILVPEPGCVLVATEKVDGQKDFERTVVLLLNAGSGDPRERPFGVILNRPRQMCIKDMEPTDPDLAEIFAHCPLYYGGPLEASIFLLTTEKNVPTDFEEVIPGLCYGARNSLHYAAELVRNNILEPQNFRFFLGFSGWELDQLKNEIALDYWYVAACSSNLITSASTSSSGLWEEILELMGGQYAELVTKSKEDNL